MVKKVLNFWLYQKDEVTFAAFIWPTVAAIENRSCGADHWASVGHESFGRLLFVFKSLNHFKDISLDVLAFQGDKAGEQEPALDKVGRPAQQGGDNHYNDEDSGTQGLF